MTRYPDLFRSWPANEMLVSYDPTTGIAVFFNIKCATTRTFIGAHPSLADGPGPTTPSALAACRPQWAIRELARVNAVVEPEALRWAEIVDDADRRGVTMSACRDEFIELITAQAARLGQSA